MLPKRMAQLPDVRLLRPCSVLIKEGVPTIPDTPGASSRRWPGQPKPK